MPEVKINSAGAVRCIARRQQISPLKGNQFVPSLLFTSLNMTLCNALPMTVITVRLSEKEKSSLEKYGKISDVVRDAIHAYLNNRKAEEALRKLTQYQKANPIDTSTEAIVVMVREDRSGH